MLPPVLQIGGEADRKKFPSHHAHSIFWPIKSQILLAQGRIVNSYRICNKLLEI